MDLLFLASELSRGMWIDHNRFLQLWRQCDEWNVENLLAKILARKHLNLLDPYSAFMILGDLRARILLYYAGLERQWLIRYQLLEEIEDRVATWQDYGAQVSSQFYRQPWGHLTEWQGVLHELLSQLWDSEFLSQVMGVNNQRLSTYSISDLSGSHYLFQHERVVSRLERYVRDITTQKRPLLNLHSQVQLGLPPPSFSFSFFSSYFAIFPFEGSPLTLRYLGQYAKMFDHSEEEPVPTWKAISWLLEDSGLFRTENVPADIHYRKISRQWSVDPPPAVATHPNLCSCPCRYKWSPKATLSSVEYNWPLIQGPKSTADECQLTYKTFFDNHIHHLDLVYFRVAVFSKILADWCGQCHVTIDMNQFSKSHHEFWLLLKLQY